MKIETNQYLNRADILRAIGASITQQAGSDHLVCVISGKILRTKDIYFELGYEHGDRVLTDICDRVAKCLRAEDIFARIDNNEFIILLPGIKNTGQPLMAANKIQRTCSTVDLGGRELRIQFACGVSMSPLDCDDPEALMRAADIALRHAETAQIDYVRYSECPVKTLPPVLQLEAELNSAISGGDLDALFQPVIDLESGELKEIEILTGWTRGTNGPVDPELFVDLADRSGQEMPLMGWGLNNALRECKEWQSELRRVRVAMNLTGRALHNPYLPETVKRALSLWETRDRMLSIEVNEDAIMSDPKLSSRILHELHDHGVIIAIDDFGTGSSSLGYLKELPLDVLKIDRLFVADMIANVANRQIVQTVIDLAHNFDLSVVAKGVLDEETLDTLTLMGCQCAQGEFVAKPMLARELGPWFAASPWEQLPDPNNTASLFEDSLTP